MSTYVDVTGRMRADRAAFEALLVGPAHHWLTCETGETSPDDGLLSVAGTDEGDLVVSADGCYRNIGIHLGPAIFNAAAAGEITGAFEICCTDGSTWRQVIVVGPESEVLVGEASCLNVAVELTKAAIVDQGETGGYRFRYLVGTRNRVGIRIATTRENDVCDCGGWDEDNDNPVCATIRNTPKYTSRSSKSRSKSSSGGESLDAYTAGGVCAPEHLEATFGEMLDDPALAEPAAFRLGVMLVDDPVRNASLIRRWLARYPEPDTDTVKVAYAPRLYPEPAGPGGASALTWRPVLAPGGGAWLFCEDADNPIMSLPRSAFSRTCATANALLAHSRGLDPADALRTAADLDAG